MAQGAEPTLFPPAGPAPIDRRLWVLVVAIGVLIPLAVMVIGRAYFGSQQPTFALQDDGMVPTYRAGDELLYRKIDGKEARAGDVVSLVVPGESTAIIKRVVVEGPATVVIRDDQVWADNQEVPEPYLPPGVRTEPALSSGAPCTDARPCTVPAGSVFVLGDNRQGSVDSRHFGALDRSRITAHITGAES